MWKRKGEKECVCVKDKETWERDTERQRPSGKPVFWVEDWKIHSLLPPCEICSHTHIFRPAQNSHLNTAFENKVLINLYSSLIMYLCFNDGSYNRNKWKFTELSFDFYLYQWVSWSVFFIVFFLSWPLLRSFIFSPLELFSRALEDLRFSLMFWNS